METRRPPNLSARERPYLVDPLEGYPLVVRPEAEEALHAAYRALVDTGDVDLARSAAGAQLAVEPGLQPAQVLWAQADYAAGLEPEALERVRPVADELPGYVAVQLLRGRLAERAGDPVEAFGAFRAVAGQSALAADRASELEPAALDRLSDRVSESLARGRLDQARTTLDQLRRWAPDGPPTLEAAAALAAASGDVAGQLEALRALSELRPDDAELQERRADLEIEAGDPGRGLEIYQTLAAAHPRDARLAEKVAYAKFRWRLTLLPEKVQDVARSAELERGDYALLLYWLLPSVRYGRPERTRIAADILDDPRREEIARVVNMDLLEMDETLHRFSPLDPVTRRAVLASLLKVLAMGDRPAACVQALPPRPSTEWVCAGAVRCTLLERVEDCLPEASISGREALGLVRRTLELASVK